MNAKLVVSAIDRLCLARAEEARLKEVYRCRGWLSDKVVLENIVEEVERAREGLLRSLLEEDHADA